MSAAGPPAPATPHWTGRAVILVALGGVLTALALAIRSSVPLFLGMPLLLAPVAAALFVPRGRVVVHVDWVERGSGPTVRVHGRLRADGGVPASQLYPRIECPAPLAARSAPVFDIVEDALDFQLDWETPFPCATEVAVPTVAWRDPFGLLEARAEVVGVPLPVERYPPEIHRIGTVNLRRTTALPGESRSRALGASGDFFAVRPAFATDPVRRINWRASARARRLLANDYLLERTGDVILLLDVRPTSAGTRRDESLLSIERAAALGLATRLLATKARVGVGVFGEFMDAVPLGSGRRQRYRIRRRLLAARVPREGGPAERLAVSMRQYFPPGVLTILISSLADDAQLPVLAHLRRRGFPVVVLSPSPVPLLLPRSASREDRLARRLLRLVRRERLAHAWGEAPVVDWEDYWSLASLVTLLRRPARRGGTAA